MREPGSRGRSISHENRCHLRGAPPKTICSIRRKEVDPAPAEEKAVCDSPYGIMKPSGFCPRKDERNSVPMLCHSIHPRSDSAVGRIHPDESFPLTRKTVFQNRKIFPRTIPRAVGGSARIEIKWPELLDDRPRSNPNIARAFFLQGLNHRRASLSVVRSLHRSAPGWQTTTTSRPR